MISLVIIASIKNTDLEEKTCCINYFSKYSYDSEICRNIIKFDVRKPRPLSFWIMKENTSFHHDHLKKAYFQNIMQYLVNDSFEINIGLYNEKGIIKTSKFKQTYLDKGNVLLDSFKWNSLIVTPCSENTLLESESQQRAGRELIDFDISRYCEIEIIKNVWKKVDKEKNIKTYTSLSKVFDPCFIIKEIFYDNVGYLVYKIVLIACKEGKIGYSSYSPNEVDTSFNIGLSIIVKSINDSIQNEAKKNSLIYDMKNVVQCRVGDILIYYFTKMNS